MEIAGVKIDELEIEVIGSWPLLFRVIVIAFACGLIFFVGYMLNWTDKLLTLNAANNKEMTIKNVFVETQVQVTNLSAYKNEVTLVAKNLSQLTEQLPQKNEDAAILEDISQQAASNGLQLVTIKPDTQQNKGFYQESPMELTLTGNMNGFGGFISKVSNMNRIVTFHDFSIKKNDTTGKGPLMMVVTAKTYWSTGKE